jgi:hypothetical protein
LKRLLIGDNAFIGVSHLSHARAREKLGQLNPKAIVEVVARAVSSGATGFTFTVHPTNFEILKALNEAGILGKSFELLPVLPYAAGYVRTVNETGMMGLANEVMSRLSALDKAKALLRSGASAVTLDTIRMLGAYVDIELAGIGSLHRANLTTVLLHEVVTDLGLSFQSKGLFDFYIRHVRDKYHATPGFVTRNFTRFVKFFEDSGVSLSDITVMTPMNRIGFQMNPSKEACEECLSRLPKCDVVAMSILAGGYLGLEEAIEYLRGLANLTGVVVGVSSKEHSQETFARLRTLFA